MKKTLGLGALAVLAATPAMAHHPLGGMPMETFAHGALSGVGHPILGFDHLFFVIAMGVAATFTARAFAAPLAYIAAMLVGVLAAYAGILPAPEALVVLSLIVLGGLVLSGRSLSLTPILGLFALFGLFHGAAFAGSLAGQEGGVGGAVMVGYLIGLGAVQYLIAVGSGCATRHILGATEASATNGRLVGAMVAGVGLFLGLELLEGPALVALGLG